MTSAVDPTNRWPLHGDPTRLIAAAAVLRAGDAEQIFGTRFPGEFVMTGVARLLEVLADRIHEHVDLGHDLASAATEIAEHVLAYVPRDRGSAGSRAVSPTRTELASPPRPERGHVDAADRV